MAALETWTVRFVVFRPALRIAAQDDFTYEKSDRGIVIWDMEYLPKLSPNLALDFLLFRFIVTSHVMNKHIKNFQEADLYL